MTNPPLKDKITVVTGAASGIGRELARGLPSAGARVVVVDRDGSGLEETCSSIGTKRSLPLTVDLLEDGVANEIVEEALSAFGGLDILVNCADPDVPRLKAVRGGVGSRPRAQPERTFLMLPGRGPLDS